MTTIFTSKIEELPPTSDMKMIDIWLIFCLVVPFLEVVLRTAIECMSCSCHVCKPKDDNEAKAGKDDKKKGGDAIQGGSSGEVTRVWVGTGAKVAPQQVANYGKLSPPKWMNFQTFYEQPLTPPPLPSPLENMLSRWWTINRMLIRFVFRS